mgnify:CR=1 FL=1
MQAQADRTLSDWLAYIESVHPRTIDLSLDRPRRVMHQLRPVRPAVVITVAGTNGKGSTAAMLDAVYRAAGYRVATYTSPHLVQYGERVRINGKQAFFATAGGSKAAGLENALNKAKEIIG